MSVGILACESLLEYVYAARRKLNRFYPVFVLGYCGGEEPAQMRRRIVEQIDGLPQDIDTVLVAMGFCGGSWDQVITARRVVIPRVDDCVSLLLNTGREHDPNPKEPGHLYITERHPHCDGKRFCQACPRWKADTCYAKWFANHSRLDIVDTGVFDCYAEQYVEDAQCCAESVNCALDYVPGSNRMMEKLLLGQWDNGFLIAGPGQRIGHKDFFDISSRVF